MIKRKFGLIVLLFCCILLAEVRLGNRFGAGTRALSFANNYTAVASDLSAVYWNPAALAFLPVREFQVTVDGFRNYSYSDITGKSGSGISDSQTDEYHERIRLSNAGVMSAVPTVQGGLTLAAAYQTPYVFDDVYSYGYRTAESLGGYSVREDMIKYGDLRMWSAAFGVQVAPGWAAGFTGSLLTGKEYSKRTQDISLYDDPVDYEDIETEYIGFDFRGGVLYRPNSFFRLGARVVIPQRIRFTEKSTVEELMDDLSVQKGDYESKGTMRSAPSGSMGMGFTLPWLTLSTEGRFTMPYTFVYPGEDIPESSQARYFKLGGGVGVEIPLADLPVMVRLGYSYDEFDLHQYVYDYDDFDIDWSDDDFTVHKDKQTYTAGVGFVSSGTGIEISYGYQVWGITHENRDRVLKQDYNSHRAKISLITRY
ncbi:MAG: hypothetical protein ACLFQB_03845 [Chitinispirillaceae bacterium]